jgi:hypothetical protein
MGVSRTDRWEADLSTGLVVLLASPSSSDRCSTGQVRTKTKYFVVQPTAWSEQKGIKHIYSILV